MKNIASPKNTFLLEAPLEVLHAESLEWLEEVEFWKDEAAFFYTLIIERTKQDPSAFGTREARDVEKHLIHVSVGKLEDMRVEVQAHERFLSRLMENPKLDEHLYRSRHKLITEKIHAFHHVFKEMKRKIFLMAEKAPGKRSIIA